VRWPALSRWNGHGACVVDAKRLRVGAVLFFLCVSGCVHWRPEDRILSAFSGGSSDWLSVRDSVPQFVLFRDARTARIFKGLTGDGKYRLAPTNELLLCPGVAAAGNHGYVIGARVDKVTGETAVATVSQSCRRFVPDCAAGQSCVSIGDVIEFDSQYLLQKTNNGWRVVKPLGRFVMGFA
jgi:hypothetical protein